MESNSTDTNKLAHHIFAACNPISIILVNLYNQLETTKEKYKESERSARADNIEYGHIPDIRSQIKRTSAFTRITDTIKAEGVRHSVKRRNQTIKLWKMNHSNLHNRYSRNQKQEWFNWVVSVPENTSYSRSSMGRHEHGKFVIHENLQDGCTNRIYTCTVSRPRKPSGRLKEVLAR